jgi:methionine sulfoxide reductase heme-binding subunit
VARNTTGRWSGQQPAPNDYQSVPQGSALIYDPSPRPAAVADRTVTNRAATGRAVTNRTVTDRAVTDTRKTGKGPADGHELKRDRPTLDEWMEVDFKFGGSRIKRKAIALVLLGSIAVFPLFCMVPALVTLNSNTFAVSVDDTLGTGAEICLFLCLLVTPMTTITGQRWFFPLRRWFGIMMAANAFGDAIAAGTTDTFAGGVFGRLTGHVFELMGSFMAMLLIPLVLTANPWAQRKLGKFWKMLHKLTYVIWGLLFAHLILLEGTGFQHASDGSGFVGDGEPIFHQRLYQYGAASLFLLVLRLPPIKRWIAARQAEGRNWVVWATIGPIFALFIFAMIFIFNEEFFKGINSFKETPSAE